MPDTATDLIDARALGRGFGRRRALADFSLHVPTGRVVALIGANGAGKTTALRLLANQLRPDHGTLRIAGIDAHRHPARARARVGYLPQRPPLPDELTVAQAIAYAARLFGVGPDRRAAACATMVARLDLDDLRDRLTGNLSEGQRQRVALAVALVHDPAVLLLDEPTASLDPGQAAMLRGLLRSLCETRAVVLATHLGDDVAGLCNEALILHQGRVAGRIDVAEAGRLERIVRLRRPLAAADLAAHADVTEARALGGNRFHLRFASETAVDGFLAAAADGLGIDEWVPPITGLERLIEEAARGETA